MTTQLRPQTWIVMLLAALLQFGAVTYAHCAVSWIQ